MRRKRGKRSALSCFAHRSHFRFPNFSCYTYSGIHTDFFVLLLFPTSPPPQYSILLIIAVLQNRGNAQRRRRRGEIKKGILGVGAGVLVVLHQQMYTNVYNLVAEKGSASRIWQINNDRMCSYRRRYQ